VAYSVIHKHGKTMLIWSKRTGHYLKKNRRPTTPCFVNFFCSRSSCGRGQSVEKTLRVGTVSVGYYLTFRSYLVSKMLCLSGKSQRILKINVCGNHVNIVSYCFCFRCSGQTQPDAHCFNTNPLRPRSYWPHSIVPAVSCDQNVYHQWLHDWNSCYTGKTNTYRGKVLLNLNVCFTCL